MSSSLKKAIGLNKETHGQFSPSGESTAMKERDPEEITFIKGTFIYILENLLKS